MSIKLPNIFQGLKKCWNLKNETGFVPNFYYFGLTFLLCFPSSIHFFWKLQKIQEFQNYWFYFNMWTYLANPSGFFDAEPAEQSWRRRWRCSMKRRGVAGAGDVFVAPPPLAVRWPAAAFCCWRPEIRRYIINNHGRRKYRQSWRLLRTKNYEIKF